MKKTFIAIEKALTMLAVLVSHVNFRGVIIIFGLALVVCAPRVHLFSAIDNTIIKASSYLFAPPLGSSGIAIVEVPKEEIAIWQSDIHSSGKLAALLSNIVNGANSTVGLILQQPIDEGAGAADTLIETYIQGASNDTSYRKAKALVDRKFLLKDYLNNSRVVVGVEGFFFAGQKPTVIEQTYDRHVFSPVLKEVIWPYCKYCFSTAKSVEVARPSFEQFTLTNSLSSQYQALFYDDNNSVFSDFFIQLLKTIENVSDSENLIWQKGQALTIGTLNLPLSNDGSFIPLHSLSNRMAPIVNTIALNEALARSAFPEFILIAQQGSRSADMLAKALYSVKHDAVVYSPWWSNIVLMALVFMVTLYLGLLVIRITPRTAGLISFFLSITIILSQILIIASHRVWLPLALVVVWLIVGHFALSIWMIKKRRIQGNIDRADGICIKQARQFIEQQELNLALEQLTDCSLDEPLLQTLYDISDAYAEQKQYQQAIDLMRMVRSKRKSYKDAEQKLKVLNTMLKSSSNVDQEDNLQKTTAITTAQTDRRIIGRYELEGELGRGAMGRVFLGFDPKIARRVAIKTLSYDQFKDKNSNELKQRFFREAEAAGRLNHPAIVSVFDVGEESDLAFIAMDFAEGKALNNFVSEDNLLPVFEVYRVVCDVAQALAYAHDSNVVHRDVKPGNIIYNPSPYQVKVTDFGIARLVDNSKTSTGEILGSPLYMAPEQLKGKKVNRAADIFSLGVTFYQLLTGRLPYHGSNLAALTYEIIYGKHKNVRSIRKDLPASASRIINQALQKDPDDRYETAAEMALVLKKAIKRDFSAEAKQIGYV